MPQGSWRALSWFNLGKQETAAGVESGCSSLPAAVAMWGDEAVVPVICSVPEWAAGLLMELQAWVSCHREQAWLGGRLQAQQAGWADLQSSI